MQWVHSFKRALGATEIRHGNTHVATVYVERHAPLVATAPELFDLLVAVVSNPNVEQHLTAEFKRRVAFALAKARGQELSAP